jgi:TolB-like protein
MIVRFAGCELDFGARELRRDGGRVTVQPKVLELIAYLIEHRDRAIGKAELQNALWPGVIVTETSLTQAVRKARRALADDAEMQNIIRTVHGHGYRFVAALDSPEVGVSRSDAAGTPHAVEAARPTIAVLPFTNLSGSDDQEYFSDAIAQDIINQLSRHRWLNVLSRNTTFGYKHSTAGLRQIALELGADYAVTGSVRRAGERIRVIAELVDARSGSQRWAERYDRRFEDLFEVQDEITGTIVARLEPEIGFAERQRVVRSAHADLQAWDSMHLGVAHLFKFTAADNVEAQRLLQKSRELDPKFGEAHAWWAYAVVLGMVYWDTNPDSGLLNEALAATQRALEIDDQNAVFYALKARVQLARGEYDSARRENELAISLNPTLAAAHCGLADTLAYQGRYDEAVDRFEMAIRMSPNDPQRWAFLTYGALALIFKREFESAISWTDRAREIPNCQYWTLAHKAVALAYLDRHEEARATLEEVLASCPGFSLAFAERKLFYLRDQDQLQMYLEGLRIAGTAPA